MEIFGILIVIVILAIVIVVPSLRICNEWQRKVVLRLGRCAGVRGPGVFFLLPYIETTPYAVDMRSVTSSFTAEQALSKDNVPVNVDTVIYWRVINPELAVLAVADYTEAVMSVAQTAMRDIIGRNDLAQVLSDRAGRGNENRWHCDFNSAVFRSRAHELWWHGWYHCFV